MSKEMGLVVNIDLCMGCFACEVACKQEHGILDGHSPMKVVTLGPYEVNGELAMDFVPIATDECNLCVHRTDRGERPSCAEVCPTQALKLCSDEEILYSLRSDQRFHICRVQ